MLDYDILRLIWWAILGIVIIGFAILDGFDLGVATLIPCLGRTDEERRMIINTIAPVWEGNQVWLILAGGATFAAWPLVYAASFSGLYVAMFLALFAVIIRPVGFKFRSKIEHPTWRKTWDTLLSLGGTIAAFVFGVAFGNLFLGFPFHIEQQTLKVIYTGSFFDLLTPFPFVCGLASVTMCTMQGACYLANKTTEDLQKRSLHTAKYASILMFLFFITITPYALGGTYGWIINQVNPIGPSNPLLKTVHQSGEWIHNFQQFPILWTFPIIALLSPILTYLLLKKRALKIAMLSSSLNIFGVISTCGIALFPFFMLSSTNAQHSLTVWDSSSSQLTLFIMLIATILFLPIVLAYTAWVYRLLKGPISKKDIDPTNNLNAY